MINRIFKLPNKLSFFLFGARGTGKSTLLRHVFENKKVTWIDLLNQDLESKYSIRPQYLAEELDSIKGDKNFEWVVIDEIQKVPALLDVVHQEIEKKRFKFALTGSSARKLKRGAANLLAGRAIQNYLYPVTHVELGARFELDFYLRWGGLPLIYDLDESERIDYLNTYVSTYLKEEIQVEQLVRKLVTFRAFLPIAAQSSGKIINYSKIANDVGSDPVSIKSYFSILEDTLIGFFLNPYHKSIRKRQKQSPKFYFFDNGVLHALRRTLKVPLQEGTYQYGDAFEHFIVNEIVRLSSYLKLDWEFSYLTTKDNVEVDLIIDRPDAKTVLIEIKSTTKITPYDVKQLSGIGKDFKNAEMLCFSRDKNSKIISGVECLHWKEGFDRIGINKDIPFCNM